MFSSFKLRVGRRLRIVIWVAWVRIKFSENSLAFWLTPFPATKEKTPHSIDCTLKSRQSLIKRQDNYIIYCFLSWPFQIVFWATDGLQMCSVWQTIFSLSVVAMHYERLKIFVDSLSSWLSRKEWIWLARSPSEGSQTYAKRLTALFSFSTVTAREDQLTKHVYKGHTVSFSLQTCLLNAKSCLPEIYGIFDLERKVVKWSYISKRKLCFNSLCVS